MKSSELIKILEKRPDAQVMVIADKDKRTYVVENTANAMTHTVFLIANKTPYEHGNT